MTLPMLRWLCGYAEFAVHGSAERFFNHCARQGLCLWNMRAGEHPSACVRAHSYRRLLLCAQRSGCRARVRRRVGLPFHLRWVRRRRGLLVGTALFALILCLLSQQVWCVQVQGNKTIPLQAMAAAMRGAGLAPGLPRAGVNPKAVQQALMLQFPQIGWVSVNNEGSVVRVEMTEGVKKPEALPERPANLLAAATGQVRRVECFAGTPQVRLGDAVAKGQLLISGVSEDVHLGDRLCHAAGRVIAETQRTFSVETPLTKAVEENTGKAMLRRSLSFYGLVVPFTVSGSPPAAAGRLRWVCAGGSRALSLRGVELPIFVYTEVWEEKAARIVAKPEGEALADARVKMDALLKQELRDPKILEKTEHIQQENGMLRLILSLRCEEDLCRESEIFVAPGTLTGK